MTVSNMAPPVGSIESQPVPLRVLMYLYFPKGGIGRYAAKVMPELTRLGVHVEAAVVPEWEWRHSPGFSTWPHLRSISHPNPIRRKTRFLIGQFVNPRRLAARARSSNADVVHICNINHLSYPAWERAFPADGPALAVTVHDVERQKRILCKSWESLQLRRFYRRADLLFVHGQNQRQHLMEYAGIDAKRIVVVPVGPFAYSPPSETKADTRRRLGIPDSCYLGLSFGLIRDEKNLDGLVCALKELPGDVHLLIAGSDVNGHRPMSFYRSLAETMGVSSRVHTVKGFVPESEVSNLFQASDWLALTYSLNFTSQSGVLSSAVHFELPILASPTATFKESLAQCNIGELCHDDSPAEIAAGLLRLHEASSNFKFQEYRMANSWESNARTTLMAYRTLCLARSSS